MWYHRWCASIPKAYYAVLSESPDPFLCPCCGSSCQAKEIAALHADIATLKAEFAQLKDSVVHPPASNQKPTVPSGGYAEAVKNALSGEGRVQPTHSDKNAHGWQTV